MKYCVLTGVEICYARTKNGIIKRDSNGLSWSEMVNEHKELVNLDNVIHISEETIRAEYGNNVTVCHVFFKNSNDDMYVKESINDIELMTK